MQWWPELQAADTAVRVPFTLPRAGPLPTTLNGFHHPGKENTHVMCLTIISVVNIVNKPRDKIRVSSVLSLPESFQTEIHLPTT
jgi:hypothetical protein